MHLPLKYSTGKVYVLLHTYYLSPIAKQAMLLYNVNHALIGSWNEPVLSNNGKRVLFTYTTGAINSVRTQGLPTSTVHVSARVISYACLMNVTIH